MKLDLDDKYVLSDYKNGEWILLKRDKRDKKRLRFYGHYPDLSYLLKGYISIGLRTSDCTTIRELLEYQKELITKLNKVLSPLHVEIVTKQNIPLQHCKNKHVLNQNKGEDN